MAQNAGAVRFPHYKAEEMELARRFLTTNELKGKWSWSVHLDTPASERLKEEYPRVAEGETWLWMKTIDAVVESDSEIVLVEFSERIRDSAIGHMLTYDRLYREQFKPTKRIRLMVVARLDDQAVRHTLEAYGIEWRLV